MAKGHPIEEELIKATGLKRKAKEPGQTYLGRLLDAADALEDSDWDKLSQETQDWCNANMKLRKADKELNGFADAAGDDDADAAPKASKRGRKAAAAEEEEAEEEEEAKPAKKGRKAAKPAADEEEEEAKPARKGRKAAAADEEEADEKPAKKSRKSASSDDEDEKPAKKPAKAAGNGTEKKTGAQSLIKKLLTKNPRLTVDDIHKKLVDKGYQTTPVAISSIRSGFRHTIKVLHEAGIATEVEL